MQIIFIHVDDATLHVVRVLKTSEESCQGGREGGKTELLPYW